MLMVMKPTHALSLCAFLATAGQVTLDTVERDRGDLLFLRRENIDAVYYPNWAGTVMIHTMTNEERTSSRGPS